MEPVNTVNNRQQRRSYFKKNYKKENLGTWKEWNDYLQPKQQPIRNFNKMLRSKYK